MESPEYEEKPYSVSERMSGNAKIYEKIVRLLGLVSTSQTCSRPGTGRALTRDLGRVTPSRPAFKGRV